MQNQSVAHQQSQPTAARLNTSLNKRTRPTEAIMGGILFFCGFLSIFTTIGVVVILGNQSLHLFNREQCVQAGGATAEEVFCGHATIGEFLTGTEWVPDQLKFGVLPLVFSTAMTSLIAMFVAVPLGLGAAIYLSEYATPSIRKTLKPILEVLAGIPTVVYGYFALTFMSPVLRDVLGQDTVRTFNMASAGLVMGIMILPLMASMSEDALSAVPRSLREGSAGLGATKLETTIRVVVPAAISGIIAALIISISRAVGETMIVAIAAGASPNFTFVPFDYAETMTGHVVRISGGENPYDSVGYNSIFAIAFLLFFITLALNIVGRYLVTRFREVYE
ncbi:MAG: phosphate ABC transporter permease subunit PstC [Anaerolineales bacterium]|nr:phosphate ABC transporter permease subunit PstC [Anaerolineales bacterium]